MPDNEIVEEKNVEVSAEEQQILSKLFEYTEPVMLPYREDYERIIKECYNFKELKQWETDDMQALAKIDVPTIAADRIGRSIDTIKGIRNNTNSKKKIVKREMGDDRVAEIIDKVADYDDYNSNFAQPKDDAFDSMIDVGIGIRKIGFDVTASGGEGEIFAEFCETEDVGYSRCKKKTLEDITWGWHRTMMDWEDAMIINPKKAPMIKGMKAMLESRWEKIKAGHSTGTLLNKDYQGVIGVKSDDKYEYKDQVYIYDFWQKKVVPYRKIVRIEFQEQLIDGVPMQMPVPKFEKAPIDYEVGENEQDMGVATDVVWHQYVVASGQGKKDAMILTSAEAKDHPFVGMCADRTKSQRPRGFIEKVMPHQKRINIALAQKMAFNNKSIKSPLIVKGKVDLQSAVQQSSFGTIFMLDQQTEVVNINTTPNVNLQAIEEGNVARSDMDFAAAASEPSLRGQVGNTNSGIQLSMQQNAAVTPLNVWVKAEQDSELLFWRKWLYLAITNYKPERYFRILGQEMFQKLVAPKIDPMTGQIIAPPVQLPLQPDVAQYDVIIQDQSVSDFQKQQSFNAIMAMQGMSPNGMFDNEFIIKNAPIKNTDDALASSEKHRNDMMFQMQQMMMQMQNQISELEKSVPKDNSPKGKPNRNPSQPSNAMQGRNASQAGQRSMVGGQLGM